MYSALTLGEGMLGSIARTAFVALALTGPAFAAEIDEFNAAIENVAAHNRVAIGYLRTGNVDLATLEIDRMRDAWAPAASRFGRPFGSFAANVQLYASTMLDVTTRLVAAQLMITTGRSEQAGQSLTAIRNDLSELRKAAGVPVLADCVRESNDAMDTLFAFDDRELSSVKAGDDVAASANAYGKILDRCDAMADSPTRQNPEFRRLIDGAKASLGLIPETIAAHDGGRLHRILIELRSYDNLLAFRFG